MGPGRSRPPAPSQTSPLTSRGGSRVGFLKEQRFELSSSEEMLITSRKQAIKIGGKRKADEDGWRASSRGGAE